MCGIAGKLSAAPIERSTIAAMTDALHHRGPDDGDTWIGDGAALGSRRLAIIDLSPRGRMPMTNEDGSLRLRYNGEIYNFAELREDLERRGHVFHSDTDSETILRRGDQGILGRVPLHGSAGCLRSRSGMRAAGAFCGLAAIGSGRSPSCIGRAEPS